MWFAGQKFTGQEIASLGTTIHKKHLWEKETGLLAGLPLALCLHQQQPMFLVTQCGRRHFEWGIFAPWKNKHIPRSQRN